MIQFNLHYGVPLLLYLHLLHSLDQSLSSPFLYTLSIARIDEMSHDLPEYDIIVISDIYLRLNPADDTHPGDQSRAPSYFRCTIHEMGYLLFSISA
jgi:hypothetical protein